MNLSIKTYKIEENFYLFQYRDTKTKYFESLWPLKSGITYNSYLYLGKSNFLFDTWKIGLENEFLSELNKIIDVKDIDYLVVHHMEPDHSGLIPKIVKENKDVVILGTPLTKIMIKNFYGIEPNFKIIRDGEKIESIKFFFTPWLHWPETMMSYIDGNLLSGDFFGSFGIYEPFTVPNDEDIDNYFIGVLSNYRDYAKKTLERLKNINLKLVCPAHGPIWRDTKILFDKYDKLINLNPEGTVILCVSMYGFSEKIAKEIHKKIGGKLLIFDDMGGPDITEVLNAVYKAKKVVFCVGTYEGDAHPIMRHYVDIISHKIEPKKALAVIYGAWGPHSFALEKLEDHGWEIEFIETKDGKIMDKVMKWFKND